MNKTKILLLFCILLGCTALSAQSQYRQLKRKKAYHKHEFSAGVLGGIHALKYDMAVGESSNKFSGGVGVGYTYFFKKNIGLATGLDFVFYNAEVKLDDFSSNHMTYDIDLQKEFDFQYKLNNYKETQNAFYLNIPIMLHYQFTDGKKVKFYGAVGIKAGLPINGKYKTSGGKLKTQGYFPHNEATMTDPYFRGFGDFAVKDNDNEIKYKLALNLAVELGAKWTLPKEMALYTGIYVDYGLNDVNESKKEDISLVQYNQLNPEDHIFNGVANSSYTPEDGSMSSIVKKINTMAYGVKVRLAFGR